MKIKWVCFFLLALACSLLLTAEHIHAQNNDIVRQIAEAAESVVRIKSQTAGAFRGKPVGYLNPNSGLLAVKQPIRLVEHERMGTGVVIDSSGLIITNAHTIKTGGKIFAALDNKTNFPAVLLQHYSDFDLAIIGIQPAYPLPSIDFADTSQIKKGEKVYAVTYADSSRLKKIYAEGQITGFGSGKNFQVRGIWKQTELIQTNFGITQGDSGAPLLDQNGKLLGIFIGKKLRRKNVSYALPANAIKSKCLKYLAVAAENKVS